MGMKETKQTLAAIDKARASGMVTEGPAAQLPEIGQLAATPLPDKISEKEFQDRVIELARSLGWRVAHFRPARTADGGWITAVAADGKGWLDLFLVRDRALAIELKVAPNKPTAEQRMWIERLWMAGVPAYVFYPDQWEAIRELLK